MVNMLAVKWSNASFPSLQGKFLCVCVCFCFLKPETSPSLKKCVEIEGIGIFMSLFLLLNMSKLGLLM